MKDFDEKHLYCGDCGKNIVATRAATNQWAHALFTLITCGLWLPFWCLSNIKIGGWKCFECGGTSLRKVQRIVKLKQVINGQP